MVWPKSANKTHYATDEMGAFLLDLSFFCLLCLEFFGGKFGIGSIIEDYDIIKAVHGAKFAKSASALRTLNADHHKKTIQSKATNREF